MVVSQEEKINLAVRKAGYKVDDVIEKLKISKQTWYNRIRKTPLDPIFRDQLKDIGVNLDEKSSEVNKPPEPVATIPMQTFLEMASDLREANNELKERLKNEIAYEKEIKDLRLRIQELEFRLKQA